MRLVHVVPTDDSKALGVKLLTQLQRQAARSMGVVMTDVVVRGTQGLLQAMERYLLSKACKQV